MPNRRKSRTFAVGMWHRKEMRWIPAGEAVNLEHLTDEEYTRLNGLYPEGMSAADAEAQARDAAEAAREEHEAGRK